MGVKFACRSNTDTVGVKIRRAAICNEGLKFFFDEMFCRAVRVGDRVIAPLRYAETG